MIIFCLVMGALASLTARHEICRVGESWMGTHLLGVAVTSLIVMAPVVAYLLLAYPAWSTLYLFDPASVPLLYMLGLLLGLPMAGALGYFLGLSLCRWSGLFASIMVFVIALSGMIVVVFLFSEQLLHVAHGMQWQDAPSLFSGDLLAIFAFSFPLVLGAWLFIITLYEVEGRKVVRASSVGALSSSIPDYSFSPPVSVNVPSGIEEGLVVPNLVSDGEVEKRPPSKISSALDSPQDAKDIHSSPPGPTKI